MSELQQLEAAQAEIQLEKVRRERQRRQGRSPTDVLRKQMLGQRAPQQAGALGTDELRLAGAGATGFLDAASEAVGAIPDLVATGMRTAGLPAPEEDFYTDALKRGHRAFGTSMVQPFVEEGVRPFQSETEAERIAEGAGRGAGHAASFFVPAAGIAKAAKAGTVTQGVARTVATAPGLQTAAASTGGAVAEATDSPLAGMAASLAVPAVVGAYGLLRQGAKSVRNELTTRADPALSAQRDISRALERDQTTPGQVRARLKTLGPEATLSDAAGSNLRGTARAAATVPGTSKDVAANIFNRRAAAEGTRINKSLSRTLKPTEYFGTQDQLQTALKTNAAPLYDRAYSQGLRLDSPKLTKLLDRPLAKEAMTEASELARLEGRRLSRLDPSLTAEAKDAVKLGLMDPATVPKGGVGRGITTEAVDDLKRGLDSLLDSPAYRNQLTGGLNKRGRIVADFKRKLLNEVDQLNPAYKQARAQYGGDAEVLSALKNGADFRRLSPKQIKRTMDGLSEAAKDAYRSGAAQRILTEISKTTDTGSVSRKLFGNDMVRQQVRQLFPDERSYREFAKTLLQERQFSITQNTVLRGSPTAPILAEQADLGTNADLVTNVATGRFGLATADLGRKAVERFTKPKPDVAEELSRMLYSKDPAINNKLLTALERSGKGGSETPTIANNLARVLLLENLELSAERQRRNQ